MQVKNRGFTLMELLVAMLLASFLTLAALAFYQGTVSTHFRLLRDYRQDSATLLEEIRNVHPYHKE